MISGAISVFIGMLPAMKITEPYSPAARAKARLTPALLTGFALAFARAVGEYGSVIFIAGNIPMRSEIAPLLIVIKLEQFDYAGAAAVGVIMLAASFLILLGLNLFQAMLAARR
jgi:sulfate transport system permease protein